MPVIIGDVDFILTLPTKNIGSIFKLPRGQKITLDFSRKCCSRDCVDTTISVRSSPVIRASRKCYR